MDPSELKSQARESLETLYDIAEKIESALSGRLLDLGRIL